MEATALHNDYLVDSGALAFARELQVAISPIAAPFPCDDLPPSEQFMILTGMIALHRHSDELEAMGSCIADHVDAFAVPFDELTGIKSVIRQDQMDLVSCILKRTSPAHA